MAPSGYSQLHNPLPGPTRSVSCAVVPMLAVEDMLMALPGSSAVASFARRSARLEWQRAIGFSVLYKGIHSLGSH